MGAGYDLSVDTRNVNIQNANLNVQKIQINDYWTPNDILSDSVISQPGLYNRSSDTPVTGVELYFDAFYEGRHEINNLSDYLPQANGVDMDPYPTYFPSARAAHDYIDIVIERDSTSVPWARYRFDVLLKSVNGDPDITHTTYSTPQNGNIKQDQHTLRRVPDTWNSGDLYYLGQLDDPNDPTLKGYYIKSVTATPLGTDGQSSSAGILPPGNGLKVHYRERLWPTKTWPDGTPMDDAVVSTTGYIKYDDENGASQKEYMDIFDIYFYNQNLAYRDGSSAGDTVAINKLNFTTANPSQARRSGDIVDYRLDVGEGTNYRAISQAWIDPVVAFRLPKGITLAELANITQTTDGKPVRAEQTYADANYTYYKISATPTPGRHFFNFTIDLKLKVEDNVAAGTYVIDQALLSSSRAEFGSYFAEFNNTLTVEEAAKYGFAAGHGYFEWYAWTPTPIASLTVVRPNTMNSPSPTNSQTQSPAPDVAVIPRTGDAGTAQWLALVIMSVVIAAWSAGVHKRRAR
jgi:hypothetical protein